MFNNIGFILHHVTPFLTGQWWLNILLSKMTILPTWFWRQRTLIWPRFWNDAFYRYAQCTPFWRRHGKPRWLLCKFSMKSYPKLDITTAVWGHKLQDYEKWATKHVCVCRRYLCISQLSRASRHGVIFKQALADCTGCLKNAITFEYPGCSMVNINFLIFGMLLLTWVLWHPNLQASGTHGSQSVVLQDQLRHGSLIRLKFINMVSALSFSKAKEHNYSRFATTSSIC